MSQLYGQAFFRGHTNPTRRSAEVIAPRIHALVRPESIIDVGCALGEWAAVFAELGCAVRGVDGGYVDRSELLIPESRFTAADLAQRLEMAETFDLAVCLEVAEHLEPIRATSLVADLVALAPIVYFSAAVPGQGGDGHVHEQWPDFWRSLFNVHGYVLVDCVRRAAWSDLRVRWWYAQNSFLYVRRDHMTDELRAVDDDLPIRLVHPDLFGYWRAEAARLRARSPFREIASRVKRKTWGRRG